MFCIASFSVSNAHALGATATVKKLDLVRNTATIEVTNTSDKDITAYSVSVDAVHVSGAKDHSERMHDYGALLTAKGEALHPGETSEQPEMWAVTAADPLLTAEVKVVAVVYSDQTAEVRDKEAFQRIVEHRTSVTRALRTSADIIKNALADPTDDHPTAKVVSDVTAALNQAKASHSLDIDEVYLQGTRDELQKAPLKSAERGINERAYLAERLATLQAEVSLHEKYAQIRRAQ